MRASPDLLWCEHGVPIASPCMDCGRFVKRGDALTHLVGEVRFVVDRRIGTCEPWYVHSLLRRALVALEGKTKVAERYRSGEPLEKATARLHDLEALADPRGCNRADDLTGIPPGEPSHAH